MRCEEDGNGDSRFVVLLGWGNRPEHAEVAWLLEHLVEAGYRVSAFELPRTITDFESEYLDPITSHVADLDSYRLLSHSTGGLIARYLDADEGLVTRTYLSPWWGFHDDLENPLIALALRLPVSTPILPNDRDAREELGGLISGETAADAPAYAAPTFLREARRAQKAMPPFGDEDVVFYTPSDPIVGTGAIESQTPAGNRVTYEGGHELFSSRCREELIDTVLAAVDRGLDGLE